MNMDYILTKDSYVTMMGPRGKCPILFMMDFAFKYHIECFYRSRTFVVCINFFSLLTFHFGKQNPKVVRRK